MHQLSDLSRSRAGLSRRRRYALAAVFPVIVLFGTVMATAPARAAGQAAAAPQDQVETLSDLPLVEVPAPAGNRDVLAVHLTGDGGWGVTDKGLSQELAAQGIPVVALNSLKYFWKRRTPEEASRDLARILTRYLQAWHKDRILLIGYSLGADVLPFMYNRLPDELREKVVSVALLGPSPTVEFEFHLTDWMGRSPGKDSWPVRPEVEKITRPQIICIYGADDKDTICPDIDPQVVRVKVVTLPTGHRFGKDFRPIADAILADAASAAAGPR